MRNRQILLLISIVFFGAVTFLWLTPLVFGGHYQKGDLWILGFITFLITPMYIICFDCYKTEDK